MKIFFCIILFLQSYQLFAQIPSENLIGHWPFNGNAIDISGNNLNGIVNGALLTNDRFGNEQSAYSFNTNTDHIKINNVTITPISSFSAWIKKSGDLNSCKVIGSCIDPNSECLGGDYKLYTIGILPESKIIFGYSHDVWVNNRLHVTTNNSVLLDDEWKHIVVNMNYPLRTAEIWINGELKSISTISEGTGSSSTTFNLAIGLLWDEFTSSPIQGDYYGAIDDVRIFNRTLTGQEITSLYNEGDNVTNCLWEKDNNNLYFNRGNVGIGTENPAATLTVDGTILSTKVQVKTDVSTYPDFVFEPNYELQTIEELEQYILKYNHLPGIPKSNEVKNGIDIGDMNIMLLQKIEELTLYIIEQNKKIQQLNKEIKALKKNIE